MLQWKYSLDSLWSLNLFLFQVNSYLYSENSWANCKLLNWIKRAIFTKLCAADVTWRMRKVRMFGRKCGNKCRLSRCSRIYKSVGNAWKIYLLWKSNRHFYIFVKGYPHSQLFLNLEIKTFTMFGCIPWLWGHTRLKSCKNYGTPCSIIEMHYEGVVSGPILNVFAVILHLFFC